MTLEELEAKVADLSDKLDTILKTAADSEANFKHEKGLEEFTSRNGETLGKYADTMKKLNGDDFDIYSAAFDEYNNDFSDIEEATYVAQLVSEIDNKIAKLKEALGEDHVMVESDGDETKVETHDEVIETEAEDAEEKDEESTEEEVSEEESDEEEADEEAEFVKELEEEYEKYNK